MATTSVTLRIPNEILEKLPQARGERSRALIELLRKGLSLPTGDETLNELINRIEKLEKQEYSKKIESQKWQDDILKRLSRIETSKKPLTEKENISTKEPEKEVGTLSLFEKSNSAPTAENTTTTEEEIPKKSQLMNSSELLKILKQEMPEKRWKSDSLVKYRTGKNAEKWHDVGKCQFKFSQKRGEGQTSHERQWKFWVLYPRPED